jgi:hypothetical protein
MSHHVISQNIISHHNANIKRTQRREHAGLQTLKTKHAPKTRSLKLFKVYRWGAQREHFLLDPDLCQ